jgi:hypothetical protein
MLQEGVEVLVGSAAVFAAEASDSFSIGPLDRRDFNSRDGASGASVSFRNVAAANKAKVNGHVTQRILIGANY